MENQLSQSVSCCICRGASYSVVYPALSVENIDPVGTFKSSGDQPTRDQVVRCSGCGLVYVNPRLKAELIVKGYAEGEDPRFVSQARGRELTFERCMKRIMRRARKPGVLLDVGTAGGSFLSVAQRFGWTVDGVEPSRWLCDWAREHYGLSIRCGTLEQQRLRSASYDLVSLWDVLEHIPEPGETLTECRRILRPGGLLVVNYPDIGSMAARVMGRRWVFLLSVHLWYFDRRTIARFMESRGFRVLEVRRHWQTLSLGYLALRFEPYSKNFAKLASRTVSALGLAERQIPYWLGQTFVLAERI